MTPAGAVAARAGRAPSAVGRRVGLAAGLVIAVVALALACLASVAIGSRVIDPFNGSATDLSVVLDMRIPRTILGVLAGAALALGGTLLQGVARNPLADPGIMGINAGAAVAVVVAIVLFGSQTSTASVWFAFLGAGIATVLVYLIASFGREGATPVKLALAGVAVTAAFSSITSAIVLSNVDALNELRVWQVGALAGRYWPVVAQLAPYFVVGTVAALLVGRSLNGLALGDDVARALGQRIRLTRVVLFTVIAVLCGAATAACGPIAFVGLMVPHLARLICGPDYRWILPYSLLLGPLLLLVCDIIGRVVASPGEVQVGVIVGIIGAPVFVALARLRRVVEI
ncbi:MAG: iron chelate uptake ABC transporter family permease subunit [Leifsonia flava]